MLFSRHADGHEDMSAILESAEIRTDRYPEIENSKRLANKVAVITGGSTGMGLATAKRFVQEGMDHVFITGRRKAALDAAVAEVGEKATGIAGDVASPADLDRLYESVKAYGRKIDVVFANAGIAQQALGFTAFGVEAGEIMSGVQIAMIAGMPDTQLRDAVLMHPAMMEGLIPLFASETNSAGKVT
jgi:NAD(P)-dependent dehydrogenase (short-subunit alcohol dehydrogenase family)